MSNNIINKYTDTLKNIKGELKDNNIGSKKQQDILIEKIDNILTIFELIYSVKAMSKYVNWVARSEYILTVENEWIAPNGSVCTDVELYEMYLDDIHTNTSKQS